MGRAWAREAWICPLLHISNIILRLIKAEYSLRGSYCPLWGSTFSRRCFLLFHFNLWLICLINRYSQLFCPFILTVSLSNKSDHIYCCRTVNWWNPTATAWACLLYGCTKLYKVHSNILWIISNQVSKGRCRNQAQKSNSQHKICLQANIRCAFRENIFQGVETH